MRQCHLPFAIAVVLCSVFAVAATYSLQQPVEQQSPLVVTNPFPDCAWDVDDRVFVGAGDIQLAPGESYSVSICMVADWGSHMPSLEAFSEKGANFVATLSVPTIGFTSTSAVPVPYNQQLQRAQLCANGPSYDEESPDLVTIEGSNGGRGKVVTIVFTITNVGDRTLRKGSINARLNANGSNFATTYCPDGQTFWPLSTNMPPAETWGTHPGPQVWWIR